MAEAASNKKVCVVFEPQTWRPQRCKNCFRSEAQHPPEATSVSPAEDFPTSELAKVVGPSAGDARVASPDTLKSVTGSISANVSSSSEVAGSVPTSISVPHDGEVREASDPVRCQADDLVRAAGISVVAPSRPTHLDLPQPPPAASEQTYIAYCSPTLDSCDWTTPPEHVVTPPSPPTLSPIFTMSDADSPIIYSPHGTFEDISRSSVADGSDLSAASSPDPNRTRSFHHIRRQRSAEADDTSPGGRRRRRRRDDDGGGGELSREDAMAEGARLILDTLRDKVAVLEENCGRLEREKQALGDLLAVRKAEFTERDLEAAQQLEQLEDTCSRLAAENNRLAEVMQLPPADRSHLQSQEHEILDHKNRLEHAENHILNLQEDNKDLAQEIADLHVEMDEMHDQFREDEAIEFRQLQKELEATAKNCRILQFKLRKADRRYEMVECERSAYEDKLRQLERRYDTGDMGHVREIEEELRMAKEVSVRLHDELEMVEERRIKAEEELARATDYLRESESRRLALQHDCEALNDEVEQLRAKLSQEDMQKLNLPPERPMLRKIGSQGSAEQDIEQLMRDLNDHLERENDLKEQLNNAEEENRSSRKKLSDLEDENETLTIQLQKMTTRSKNNSGDKPSGTEDSPELQLQLDLMENEMKVLRRKLSEMEDDNDKLKADVGFYRGKLEEGEASPPPQDERPFDEKIQAMAIDIDELKWKLIQKDQQVEKLIQSKDEETRRGTLKKTKSLDGEANVDVKRQLELVQQEAGVLREKIDSLDVQNDRLIRENQKLQLANSRNKIPAIMVDDPAAQSQDLQERVKELEQENNTLKKTVKEKTERLSRLASGVKEEQTYDVSREALQLAEEEVAEVRMRLEASDSQCETLMEELRRLSGKDTAIIREELSLEKHDASLAGKIKEMDAQLKHAQKVLSSREEENERLLEEISGYREDIDNIMSTFRERERELLAELETINTKNKVVANLLDMVMEPVELAHGPRKPGSDPYDSLQKRDPEDQFMWRIAKLEQLVEEDRSRALGIEKARSESPEMTPVGLTDDAKMYEREKEIVQKELALCQKQLLETNEIVKDLKTRLQKVETAHEDVRRDYEKATKDLERERQQRLERMLTEEKSKSIRVTESPSRLPAAEMPRRTSTGGIMKEKEPASWRWEKQQFESQIKDWKKKYDDLDAKLRREQTKLRMTDKTREDKLREDVEKLRDEKDKLKDEREKFRKQSEEFESTLKEVQDTLHRKSKQWDAEREIMDKDKKSAERETNMKDDIIKQKDDIIRQKDDLVKQKEGAIKDKEESLRVKETIIKGKEEEFVRKNELTLRRDEEQRKAKEQVTEKSTAIVSLENRVRALGEDIRHRDERLREKDELLEKLNKDLSEMSSRAGIMEAAVHEGVVKIKEKEAQLGEIKALADDYTQKAHQLEEKLREAEVKLNKTGRERDKETAALVIQREKLENQLEFVSKEKKCMDDEIRLLRKNLEEKEDDWTRQKSKYECDISKERERRVSLEKMNSPSDKTLKELFSDNDRLVKDNQRLEDVIKKLRTDVERCRESQAEEVADLRKVLYETKKKLDEKTRECSRLNNDSVRVSSQHGAASNGSISETTDSALTLPSPRLSPMPDLALTLERQELLWRAEKAGMEELYRARECALQDQLSLAHSEATRMRGETDTQAALLVEAGRGLTEVKRQFEGELAAWGEERVALEHGVQQGKEYRELHDSLQKTMEQASVRLLTEESRRQDAENLCQLEQKHWELERSALTAQMNELRRACGQDLRDDDQTRATEAVLIETKALINSIAHKMAGAETTYQAEVRALTAHLEDTRRQHQTDTEQWQARMDRLNSRAAAVPTLQKNVMELQQRLTTDREAWLVERDTMAAQLADARRIHLEERAQVAQVLTQIKQAKGILPTIELEPPKTSPAKAPSDSAPSKPIGSVASSIVGKPPASPVRKEFVEHKKSCSVERSDSKRSSSESLEKVHRTESFIHLSPAMHMINDLLEKATAQLRLVERAPALLPRQSPTTAPATHRRTVSCDSSDELVSQILASPLEGARTSQDAPNISIRSREPSPIDASRRLDEMLKSPTPVERSPSPDSPNDEETRTNMKREPSLRTLLSSSTRPTRRSSRHKSGTQSAVSSREPSPGGEGRRGPYPAPPPSFLVTPPRSPRHFQPSPHASILTSENMMKLYAKLGAIETGEEGQISQVSTSAAIVDERTAALRIIKKSQSVNAGTYSSMEDVSNQASSSLYIQEKRKSNKFVDADLSQTLPASIRMGGLVITPGIENLCKGVKMRKQQAGSQAKAGKAESSRKSNVSNLTRSQSVEPGAFPVIKPKSENLASRMNAFLGRAKSVDKDTKEQPTSPDSDAAKPPKGAGSFISNMMEKRRMFGYKREGSAESTASAALVQAGSQAAGTAVPAIPTKPTTSSIPQMVSTCMQPAEEPAPTPSEKKKVHRRSFSLDLPHAIATMDAAPLASQEDDMDMDFDCESVAYMPANLDDYERGRGARTREKKRDSSSTREDIANFFKRSASKLRGSSKTRDSSADSRGEREPLVSDMSDKMNTCEESGAASMQKEEKSGHESKKDKKDKKRSKSKDKRRDKSRDKEEKKSKRERSKEKKRSKSHEKVTEQSEAGEINTTNGKEHIRIEDESVGSGKVGASAVPQLDVEDTPRVGQGSKKSVAFEKTGKSKPESSSLKEKVKVEPKVKSKVPVLAEASRGKSSEKSIEKKDVQKVGDVRSSISPESGAGESDKNPLLPTSRPRSSAFLARASKFQR